MKKIPWHLSILVDQAGPNFWLPLKNDFIWLNIKYMWETNLEPLGVELGLQTSDHGLLSEGPHQVSQVLNQRGVSHCQEP